MRWFGSLILPIIYLIICIIGLVVKPKNNMFFGYRTSSSMQNKEIWQKSNQFFFKIFLALDIVLNIPISIVLAVFVNETLPLVISCLAISVVVLIVAILITEIKIKTMLKNKD